MSSLRVYGRRDDQLKQRSVGAGGFLDHVDVQDAISLSTDRSVDAATIDIPDLREDDVLEISLEDGLKIWTRWDDLQSDMAGQLVRGEGDELVLPSSLRLGEQTRGAGDWALTALRRVGFDLPGATGQAVAQALEGRLEQAPGLYRWSLPDGMQPVDGGSVAADRPALLFIHGTMSSTVGSFGGLLEEQVWQRFTKQYGDQIYALEHRTLSLNPIQNALELLELLPESARLHLVTHSRGGLVGELLCRGGRISGPPIDELDLTVFEERHGQGADDLERLERLGALLTERRPAVERFVRVGCPAAGTTLASGRLDRYLSLLRNVIGAVPALKASQFYEFVTAFLLAVVKQRTDPKRIPGLEAQMPESPLVAMVNRPDVSLEGDLSVIAGDIVPSGVFARLGVLALDAFFLADHDLVVNTVAMLGGAPRKSGGRAMLTKGTQVNHFQYFKNEDTVRAIGSALEGGPDGPAEGGTFIPLDQARGRHRDRRFTGRGSTVPRPTVFVVPGLMGSHLEVAGNRVWLDIADLARGRMDRLRHDAPSVQPVEPIDRVYGELSEFLSDSHDVRQFPYDWRQSVMDWGDRLGQEMERALARSDLPVRVIAHSMGGLITQAMIHRHPAVWDEVTRRGGHRVVLMGTPINGSFTIPLVLLGRESTLKKLAMLDLRNSREEMLEIVAEYQGLLDLLPAVENRAMFERAFWNRLHELHGGWTRPDQGRLEAAKHAREALADTSFGAEPVRYVAGQAPVTPSGYRLDPGARGARRIQFLGTARGDGRVPWDSGPPPGAEVYYLEGVSHGDLPAHRAAFAAYLELLEAGDTRLLSRTPPSTRGAADEFELPDIPVDLFPDEEDLETSVVGGTRSVKIEARVPELRIRVAHGNLAFASHPVVVGHYRDDLIVSAEKALDHHLGGLLRQRHAVSAYPGDVRTSAVVFNPVERRRPRGAIVVGLGGVGRLSPGALASTIAHGMREYASRRVELDHDLVSQGDCRLRVSPLLIGTGEGGLGLRNAVAAILEGIRDANVSLAKTYGDGVVRVDEVEFIELYEDRAVEALDTLRRMACESRAGLWVEPELKALRGGRRRMYEEGDEAWWHRIEVLGGAEAGEAKDPFTPLRFKALTDRARVHQELVPAQRALIDKMVEASITRTSWDPELARTLFELLLPNSFKNAARDRRSVELVLDEEAASYPWELLVNPQGDGEPASIRAGMVRRLITPSSHSPSETSASDFALVVGNPPSDMPDLPGASAEARAVADTLHARGFKVTASIEEKGTDVLKAIFGKEGSGARGYRILHLAGHGVYRGLGSRDSGMVLGTGELLTPSEVERMRFIPELVFINCCHLGRVEGGREPGTRHLNRLAANLGTQFIRCGVKAVVTAGWAVNDSAAELFATTFYGRMLDHRETFGDAVRVAREEVRERFAANNTWAAYQCYGDHSFVLRPGAGTSAPRSVCEAATAFSAPAHAILELDNIAGQAETASTHGHEWLQGHLTDVVSRIPDSWVKGRADVQAALGKAWGRLGDHDRAQAHLGAALAMEGSDFPVRSIEAYANVTVRAAFMRWSAAHATTSSGKTNDRPDRSETSDGASIEPEARTRRCKERIHAARELIVSLMAIGELRDGASSGRSLKDLPGATSERLALLGSAHKRLAAMGGPGSGDDLLRSRDRYGDAVALAQGDGVSYPLLNWLYVVALRKARGAAEKPALFLERLDQMATEAARKDEQDPSFFNHVLTAEVKLIQGLWEGAFDPDEIMSVYGSAWIRGGSYRSYLSIDEHLDCMVRLVRRRRSLVEALNSIRAGFGSLVAEDA
jgi:hypothetical protein